MSFNENSIEEGECFCNNTPRVTNAQVWLRTPFIRLFHQFRFVNLIHSSLYNLEYVINVSLKVYMIIFFKIMEYEYLYKKLLTVP